MRYLFLFLTFSFGTILHVDGENYTTIQSAVDDAQATDTVLVAEGIYSPSTNGESFPLEIKSNVNLFGTGEELTILDAEQTDRVITMEDCDNNTISELTLRGGLTDSYGGGMFLENSNPTLTHVTITNNKANDDGGGIRLFSSNPTLTNVTISNNTAIFGGGMFLNNSNSTFINSIVWGNSPESIYLNSDGQPIITYSNIQGGWEGEGIIDTDPFFTDPLNGDYTLQDGSPCIDAGTAFFEIDSIGIIIDLDESEYYGSAPDMGAFEYEPLSIEEQDIELPAEYVLHPAYPNPFNPVTTITFGVPAAETLRATSLQVFDITGRQVETLLKGLITPGFHSIEWNAEGYPSGIYFIKLNAGGPSVNSGQGFTQTQKLMLVK